MQWDENTHIEVNHHNAEMDRHLVFIGGNHQEDNVQRGDH